MSAFRNIAAVLGSCILAAGCTNGVSSSSGDYDVDPQTGLCFKTSSQIWANNYALTNVPCTKEVLNLVPLEHRAAARVVVPTAPAP